MGSIKVDAAAVLFDHEVRDFAGLLRQVRHLGASDLVDLAALAGVLADFEEAEAEVVLVAVLDDVVVRAKRREMIVDRALRHRQLVRQLGDARAFEPAQRVDHVEGVFDRLQRCSGGAGYAHTSRTDG